MKSKIRTRSRKSTPWDSLPLLSPSQEFIRDNYKQHYFARHRSLCDSDEAALLNHYRPENCPNYGSAHCHKDGTTANGLQRYRCNHCGKSFSIVTGTIFEDHKLPLSEWIEYCLNLIHYSSISADSRNNKNAMSTSVYWLHKVFEVLDEYLETYQLHGTVFEDETYYSMIHSSIQKKNGKELRGLSKNKICIATACDDTHVYCHVCGSAKPSSNKIVKLFKGRIEPGSKLIHDGDNSHSELVKVLGLHSEVHTTAETKELDDKDNPLDRINHLHFLLKNFLRSHPGFKREDLQGYLNLFCFIMNPPFNDLEKVDILMNLAIKCHKTLRYRQYFSKK